MKIFFHIITVFLLLFISCKNANNISKSDNKIITEKVNLLYQNYGNYEEGNQTIYSKPLVKDLFFIDLKNKLEKSIEITNIDSKKIKESNHPTDKPKILEGSIFTSLYEGYSSYDIENVTIANKDKSLHHIAKVTVKFINDKITPIQTWTDTILLVNTNDTNNWRISNIIFDKKLAQVKDLNENLNNFISE